ncbi:putative porin [Sulfuricella sp. T08]|uniref:putative porin n=1 Tax=Sulfuricella sp. T08 TaxID=1632857 RepID=UPI001ED9B303|nr:putative porin [Sulfuricella sp. T08]
MLLATLVLTGGPAWGSEREDLEIVRQTTINLINALVKNGVLSQEAAQGLIKQAEDGARQKVAAKQAADEKIVRVPYVPETVKREIREQIKQEVVAQAKTERWGDVNAVPEWVERIKLDGDIRLRSQTEQFSKSNVIAPVVDAYYGLSSDAPTTENRDRLRVRARLGLAAKISDMVSGGLRLATGNTTDPVSTNQTLGNSANKYSFLVDQAYLKVEPLEPQQAQGPYKTFGLSFIGGKIPNPWFSTDLVWDPDINFEGVAANGTYRFNERGSVYLTAGAFPLQDIAPSTVNKAKNKWLYGAQAGLDLAAQNGSKARFGLALYDYKHVEGILETDPAVFYYAATAPQFRQKGNSIFLDGYSGVYKLASKFRELNLTAQLDLANFDPMHVLLTGDYVRNIGYDETEMLARTGILYDKKKNVGYQLQAAFGRPKVQNRGEWQAFAGYRYLERDAVLDAFTDSDFHLGGTDAKGYYLGGSYGIDHNTWLSMKWMSADSIDGPKFGIDVLHVDLNAKF